MPSNWRHLLAVQLIRYLAATQALWLVLVHGGWMLLALTVWRHAGDDGSPAAATALRWFARLGGVGENGHGDESDLFVVWGKLSLVPWLAREAWRAWRGPRPPASVRALLGVIALSGAVAFVGYFLAMRAGADGQAGGVPLVAAVFAVVALGATAWTIASQRIADWLVARIADWLVARIARGQGAAPGPSPG